MRQTSRAALLDRRQGQHNCSFGVPVEGGERLPSDRLRHSLEGRGVRPGAPVEELLHEREANEVPARGRPALEGHKAFVTDQVRIAAAGAFPVEG